MSLAETLVKPAYPGKNPRLNASRAAFEEFLASDTAFSHNLRLARELGAGTRTNSPGKLTTSYRPSSAASSRSRHGHPRPRQAHRRRWVAASSGESSPDGCRVVGGKEPTYANFERERFDHRTQHEEYVVPSHFTALKRAETNKGTGFRRSGRWQWRVKASPGKLPVVPNRVGGAGSPRRHIRFDNQGRTHGSADRSARGGEAPASPVKIDAVSLAQKNCKETAPHGSRPKFTKGIKRVYGSSARIAQAARIG